MRKAVGLILLVLVLHSSAFVAAQPAEQPATRGVTENQQAAQPSTGDQQGMEQMQALMQNMDKMATTMTRMAEICELMIKREMATFPYMIAAGIGFGVIVTLVLLLLVLEVQWIVYWSRILKEQKRK
ncbi:MAG: hypothetical protein VR65_08685 [Desulfobulbaceae bacterium BRH_c16a]|nr:MAG: hypothetical protein VR65_08685 [Desulfobulbaceae bacterium BRH_c16a]